MEFDNAKVEETVCVLMDFFMLPFSIRKSKWNNNMGIGKDRGDIILSLEEQKKSTISDLGMG